MGRPDLREVFLLILVFGPQCQDPGERESPIPLMRSVYAEEQTNRTQPCVWAGGQDETGV